MPPLPGPDLSLQTGVRPVVFLHGVWGDPGNFAPTIRLLVDAADRTVYAPAYGNRGTNHLPDSYAELEPTLRAAALDSPTGDIDIVAHSLGGLHALRAAMDIPVAHIVGLGACFKGRSTLRRLRPFMSWLVGPAMTGILADEPYGFVPDVDVISVVSSADFIVPSWSSDLRPELADRCELVQIHRVRHEQLTLQTALLTQLLAATRS